MIESRYWKEELKRIAKTIATVKRPQRWSERAHCIVERDVMIGFFIVRRLIELHKVSSATRNFTMRVFLCPARGKRCIGSTNTTFTNCTISKENGERRRSRFTSPISSFTLTQASLHAMKVGIGVTFTWYLTSTAIIAFGDFRFLRSTAYSNLLRMTIPTQFGSFTTTRREIMTYPRTEGPNKR